MRKFILLILSCLSASAAHVQFFFSDFTTATPPLTNRVLFIIPTNNNPPWIDGNVIITGDRNAYTNDGSASITVSNMVAANYFCLIRGPFKDTPFTIAVPDTNALLNANQLRGLVTNGSPSLAYSQAQSDARYVRKTNSWSSGQVLTNATFRGSTNAFTFTNGVSAGQFLSTDGTYWFPVTVSPGGGGEVNTSSNTGDGVGIAAPKSTYDLPFKSFKSANGMATWATNGTNITLTIDLASTTNVFARTTELNSASNSLVTQIASATNTLAASGRTELSAASNSLVTQITSATNTLAASGRSELLSASNAIELAKQPASANLTNYSGAATSIWARITDLNGASNHLELVKQPASSTLTNLSNTGAITNVSDAGNAFISLIYTSNNFTIKLATFQAGANVWVTNNGTNIVIAGHSTNGLSRMLSFDANQFSVVSGTNIVVKSGVLLTNVNTFGLTNQGAVNFSGTVTNHGDELIKGALIVNGALQSDTQITSAGGISASGDIAAVGNVSAAGNGGFTTALYVGENFQIDGPTGDIVKLHGANTSFPAANSEGFLLNNGSGTYAISTLPLTNTVNDGIGSGQIAITNGTASQKGKFKSLSAGSNVTLTDQGTNIAIAASASSGTSTGYVFNANQFGFLNVSNISIATGALLTNVVIYNTAAAVAKIINGAASSATNISEIWSNGVMMQNVDSNGWTRIYTRNTNAAPQDGLTLANTNVGGAGVQSYSPDITWWGEGWKTTATATNQHVKFRAYVVPVQGASAPTVNWTLDSAITAIGGTDSFANSMTYSSAGALTTASTITSGGNFGVSGSGGYMICGTAAGFRGGGTTINFPQFLRSGAAWLLQGADGSYYPSNNLTMGGQLTCTNFQNGGWEQHDGKSTNNNSINITTGGLILGASGATYTNLLGGSATLDFPSTLAQTDSDLSITVTGAAIGDEVLLGAPMPLTGSTYTAFASNDTVWIRFSVYGLSAKDPASATFRASVMKR